MKPILSVLTSTNVLSTTPAVPTHYVPILLAATIATVNRVMREMAKLATMLTSAKLATTVLTIRCVLTPTGATIVRAAMDSKKVVISVPILTSVYKTSVNRIPCVSTQRVLMNVRVTMGSTALTTVAKMSTNAQTTRLTPARKTGNA